MSTQQTLRNQLMELKMNGALQGLEKQIMDQKYYGLDFEERLIDLQNQDHSIFDPLSA